MSSAARQSQERLVQRSGVISSNLQLCHTRVLLGAAAPSSVRFAFQVFVLMEAQGFRKEAGIADKGKREIYVGNMAYSVSKVILQEIFQVLGPLRCAKIIRDKRTGLSAGYGFVHYLDTCSAAMALRRLNGRVVHGQALRVNWAFTKQQRQIFCTLSHPQKEWMKTVDKSF